MSQQLAFAVANAAPVLVIVLVLLLRSEEKSQHDPDDRRNPAPTHWRRHPAKPSHLAFRSSRFDRHPGNSRRTQRCCTGPASSQG